MAVTHDFLAGVFVDPVAPLAGIADGLKAQLLHQDAYLDGAERLTDIAVDLVEDVGRRDEDAGLARQGATEMSQNQFPLQIGRLEILVMPVEGVNLFGIEPVAEMFCQ